MKIAPELIEQLQFFAAVTKKLSDPRIVEEQTTVLVDDVQSGRTVLEDVKELPLPIRHIGHLGLSQR